MTGSGDRPVQRLSVQPFDVQGVEQADELPLFEPEGCLHHGFDPIQMPEQGDLLLARP